MRIVHVIAGLGVGGAEHFLRRLILSAQAANGAEHLVISLTTVGEVGLQLREAGVPVEALDMHSVLSVPTTLLRLKRRLAALRPDIVQGWMYHADLLGGVAARWAGQGRVVWGVRGSELVAGTPATTRATRWCCARLSARVPDVIVCAAEAGRRAHVALGYDATRTRVIPNGFDDDAHHATSRTSSSVRGELGWSAEVPVIGVIGRFHPAKGIDHFVQAAGLLRRKLPEARFLMLGRGLTTANTELMQWVGASGAGSQMALLGERTDVPRCLAAMDVLVLSSRAEGFPNVVGEAMTAGVPCVVTDVGDARLLVGDTGRVVPREDPVALADGVLQLLSQSPADRASLGDRAKARIRAEFSLARSCERFNALYAELLNGRSEAR